MAQKLRRQLNDPWRVAITTDHPNGGSFLAYPEIVQLLMDRNYRQEVLKRVPPRAMGRAFFIRHRTSHLVVAVSDEDTGLRERAPRRARGSDAPGNPGARPPTRERER